MYWYVVFVRTGKEHRVKDLFCEWLDADICRPFVPLQEKLFKAAGTVKKEFELMFPSYVFIESKLSSLDFMIKTKEIINHSRDIIRLLRYSKSEVSMRDCERQALASLYNDHFCIESSSGIIAGDRIQIMEGPLRGWESKVKKINRHKRQATIELELMGQIRLVHVALEIVQKT